MYYRVVFIRVSLLCADENERRHHLGRLDVRQGRARQIIQQQYEGHYIEQPAQSNREGVHHGRSAIHRWSGNKVWRGRHRRRGIRVADIRAWSETRAYRYVYLSHSVVWLSLIVVCINVYSEHRRLLNCAYCSVAAGDVREVDCHRLGE